jgi:formate dehydrogenase (NADP+) beta subunit
LKKERSADRSFFILEKYDEGFNRSNLRGNLKIPGVLQSRDRGLRCALAEKTYRALVPDAEYYRKLVKCQEACPVHTDSRGYVTAIARGDLALGYLMAHDPNPLSTICGRICGAPCETACRRSAIGPDEEPVAIRPLKRILTERYGPEAGIRLPGAQTAGEQIDPPPLQGQGGPAWMGKSPGAQPGEGPYLSYSQVRWSKEMLRNLAATPGRKHGKVAIIGAGPASLTVSHDLALLGHQVEIFEAGPKTGGMMRYGVPVYRIDQQAMDQEIEAILNMGVQIHFNTRIGETLSLPDLRSQYDAVFLGIGLMEGRRINMEGADLDGVITAVDLLLNYNLGYKVELGQRVIVVGGGDVAMDAARTALRLGQATAGQPASEGEAQARSDEEADSVKAALDVARTALRLGVHEVKMISLESWEELPASQFEIEEALEEGIEIFPSLGPNRILGKGGTVTALEVIEVASVFDSDGRFNPKFKPGSQRLMPCDTVILAIGQRANLDALGGADDITISPRGLVEVNPETCQTSAPDVFAGGDVAFGPRLIISAVRDGHLAALGMEAHIQGRTLNTRVVTEWTDMPNHAMFKDWTILPRTKVPTLPVDRRTGISVVEQGYSLEQGVEQGSRCLECSVNTVFDGSLCILCNGCVDVCPWDCLKIVRVDELSGDAKLDQVIERQLGAPASSWANESQPSVAAMLKDDDACTRCALCARRCPTGAITMEAFRFTEVLTYGD